jgi:acyl transferase domain-containing protein
MNSQSEITGLEIAVIGLACRFPGALTHDQFWDNLKNGRESVSFLSDEEIRELKISPDMLANKNFVRSKGSYIENKNHFDHAFFGYSQREAAVMDPQTRIMHECVWSALEDAGCNPLDYPGKIGLVAGLSPNYSWLRRSEQNTYARELGFFHASTLVERDFSSLHVAYRMNLTGPSYVIFTTCSTSLVAVHQACRALLTGESNMMVAGGVSFTQDTMGGYFFQEGMIFSADGHCRAFDKDSSGTVRGEGAGFVVLKRLKNALLDKDNIYAVIKGSAVNNDGNNKTGFFAPSVQGQKQVIQDALKTAKVDPQTVTLIEAHGTGTHIGDPIEIAGLTQAFGSSEHQYCAVGSVKSNLGHLDAAAGIASFIKTVLCIQHKWLAPSLNYKAPNPHINFAETPFYVIDQSRAWEGELLRAGVSSFGIGGTNAHVILENFDQKDTETIDRPELILLSARTKERVNKLADDLVNYSSKNKTNYSDLAFTLQTGRRHFPERAFAVTGSIHGAENLKNKFQFQATAHNSILLLTECDLESMDALLCMAAYNASLNEIVQSVLQALTERFNCSAADLNKTMTPVEVKQINCFCFQYAITAFLDKIGIIPRHIYTCSIGAQVMNALNGQTSLQKALGYIYEGCISFKSYEEGKHPYHELTDIGWQKQEPGTLIAMGKPPAYIEPHSILQGSVLLGTSGAREDFMQLLLYTGRAWTAGALVDFNYFNKGMSNRKISLPSYPFEPVKIESPLSQIKAVPEFEKWFYRFSWKKTDLIPPSEHQETQMPVLVITDNAPVTFSLTEKLKNEKPLKLIDISNADEPLVLIEAAVTEFNAGETKVILYLGFDSPTPLLSADNPARRLDLLFYKTLDIIRLLGRKNSQAFEVDLVLNCSVQVTGTDPVNYFLAPVHALAKIIPLEMKNIRCRLIDMGEDFHHSANQQVLASLVNTVTGENFFAIRNGTSWIKKLERFSPEKINKAPSYVRDKGVYLITGGFGGMGLAIADHLLTNSNATVILVGRRALHDIQRQQPVDFDILAKFPDRLEYQQAEIANAETIEAVSKKMFAKYKAINGIFHTAGLADFGGIAERRSNQSIDQVLQPKIHGTINLFKWLESDDLDFMVLFSSVGNILYKDKIGQLGYNAGNEFLDSFSQFAPKLITINWSDWKERGMTVDSVLKKLMKS